MNYEDFIRYHKKGDAGVEERVIASLCKRLNLNEWDSFRLIYYYSITYHVPSALKILEGERDIKSLIFRTDRMYVRYQGRFYRLLHELDERKQETLRTCKTTKQAYEIVCGWYYFGRYAAYLFLEVYCNVFQPNWYDNLYPKWESGENYTNGAIIITKNKDVNKLNEFIDFVKASTADNIFSIETSLCAIGKFAKGTRYDGFYTERLLSDIKGSKWESLIIGLL